MDRRAFTAPLPSGSGHVILEEQPEGCYALLFHGGKMTRDDLYDNLADAMHWCEQDHGIEEWAQLKDHEFWLGGG